MSTQIITGSNPVRLPGISVAAVRICTVVHEGPRGRRASLAVENRRSRGIEDRLQHGDVDDHQE